MMKFGIERMFEYMEKNQIVLEEYYLATGVGLPVPEYEPFKEQLRDELKKHGYGITEWEEIQIGATIGVHTGPYPMGVGFLKRVLSTNLFNAKVNTCTGKGCASQPFPYASAKRRKIDDLEFRHGQIIHSNTGI